ncbi:TetR/AcrR family transcriptional regulator [bacterium]|jgi:AcrR family transcriptional regulator|nr:TetR/AcrR family transcriptional regulator [bacterium]
MLKAEGTKASLIESAVELIAIKGFDGVSVREICEHAGTSMNMIHHYFENKEGLLQAVLKKFNSELLTVPFRALQKPVETKQDFETRLLQYFEDTLDAFVENRYLLRISCAQNKNLDAIAENQRGFVAFIELAKTKKFVRASLDIEMISGLLMDRLVSQANNADTIKAFSGCDIVNDLTYRNRWCKANIDLFLNGALV